MLISHEAFLAPLQSKSVRRFCVALSGGQDSVALLHFLRYTVNTDLPIVALHVNHHLQRVSDDWATFCVNLCEAWQVPVQILSIEVPKDSKEGLEAAARRARYAALFGELSPGDVLLTAHHAEDQAETILLQCLRGAGPRGLAAMPLQIENQSGIIHYRPFLEVQKEAIKAYIQAHQLKYIDDPSNEDIAFDRNYLRQKVMPLLAARWPSYTKTVMRSAQLSAELMHWAEPLWQKSLKACIDSDKPACLNRTRLALLSSYECTEVLRLWLEAQGLPLPSRMQMQAVLDLVYRYRENSQAEARWGQVLIKAYREHLYGFYHDDTHDLTEPRTSVSGGGRGSVGKTSPEMKYPWPENKNSLIINHIQLKREKTLSQGIALTHLKEVEVRFRSQGERFHPAGRQGSHPLKKLFQEWGVPPWERAYIPLIYAEDELIAVVGYAYHANKRVTKNEWGMVFSHSYLGK